jgi:hypothetical protein
MKSYGYGLMIVRDWFVQKLAGASEVYIGWEKWT